MSDVQPVTGDLEPCPSCGHQVHKSAEVCPGCGRKDTTPNPVFKMAAVLVAVALAVFVIHAVIQAKHDTEIATSNLLQDTQTVQTTSP